MLDKLVDAGESAVVLKKSLSAIVPDSVSGSENHVGVSAELETSRPTPVLELKLLRLRHGARVILTDIDEHNIRPFVPGFVLNGAEPGNDGCIFTIEEYRNRRDRWNLFRFSFPVENDRSFAFGELVGEGLTVHRLYRELARLDLFLLGHETIALGLPYYLDPWTGD